MALRPASHAAGTRETELVWFILSVRADDLIAPQLDAHAELAMRASLCHEMRASETREWLASEDGPASAATVGANGKSRFLVTESRA